MNESELIKRVAEVTELTRAKASQAVKALTGAIVDAASTGEVVRVPGLGIFAPTARAARRGRNPQTGEQIEIAASTALRFRAGKTIKEALNPPRTSQIRSRRRSRVGI